MNLVITIVLSYLLGSVPTSIVVSKLVRGIDIRQHGSGNAGGTNVFRVMGWKWGVFVMLVDIFKGFVATFWIGRLFYTPALSVAPELVQIFAGCSAIVGHIWTVFAGFKGGKGVGAAAGMLLALFPAALGICLLIFGIVLLMTRIVSISSISAAVTLPIVLTLFRYTLDIPVALSLYIFGFIAAALIVFTHRSNIKRLLNGTENRFGRKK